MYNRREVRAKLLRGLLNLIVLQLLRQNRMHGYQIIAKIRKMYGVYFGPSTVYPILNNLEQDGIIEGKWELHDGRPRKIYQISRNGEGLIETTEDSLRLIQSKMETTRQRTTEVEKPAPAYSQAGRDGSN